MPHASRPGDVLGERYRLEDLLVDRDGGRFWRARDRVLARHVAIHVIAAADARVPGLMKAARRSAMVNDRRVLRVLDADLGDEVCYVVNEWGWGASLDVVVASRGPMSPRRAAWLVAEVADSVAVAHALGVGHGRLAPENVLVDRAGGVRLIGLCVDAALHGLSLDDADDVRRRDVEDLAGLLYCGMTGRWAGPSTSGVEAAPCAHGEVLRPRQVRAGIPRPLDHLCEDLLHPDTAGRHREVPALGDGPASARAVAELLVEYVGDPAGMPESLLRAVPDVVPKEAQVVLPPVPEMQPVDADEPTPAHTPAPTPGGVERPTEAGLPVFDDDADDVSWLERRTAPAPPPPFEEPPERPLFAPEPDDGGPARTPRALQPARAGAEPGADTTGSSPGFLSWADERDAAAEEASSGRHTRTRGRRGRRTGTSARATGAASTPSAPSRPQPAPSTSATTSPVVADSTRTVRVGQSGAGRGTAPRRVQPDPVPAAPFDARPPRTDDDRSPGRPWLWLAGAVGVVLLGVLAAMLLIGPGGGGDGDDDTRGRRGEPSTGTASAPAVRDRPVEGVGVSAFDPQSDGVENDEDVANVLDGDPATTWSTQGYDQQLGPAGLKTGVGLVLDLGADSDVTGVDLTLLGVPTEVDLYMSEEQPDAVADLEPVAGGTADGESLSLPTTSADGAGTRARYVVVWFTSLPQDADDGRYRGTLAEVTVRAG